MNTLLVGIAVAVGVAMTFSLYRVFRGPTIFDRLSGLGLIGSKAVVLLMLLGARAGRLDMYLDVALSYALISFVGALALAKHFESAEEHE